MVLVFSISNFFIKKNSQRRKSVRKKRYLLRQIRLYSPGFFQVEKLSLHWLKNVKDEHIVALVNRCKNITTLDLAFNSITNLAMNSIVENLKLTLEELNVNFTKVTFDKVLELRVMEKIRILNCRKLNRFETINLRQLLDIRINKNSTPILVADSNSSAKPKEMFWKVKAKQIPLFQANTE